MPATAKAQDAILTYVENSNANKFYYERFVFLRLLEAYGKAAINEWCDQRNEGNCFPDAEDD